jgi:hypothetical protein
MRIVERDSRRFKANTVLLQIALVLPVIPFEAQTSRLYIYVYTK